MKPQTSWLDRLTVVTVVITIIILAWTLHWAFGPCQPLTPADFEIRGRVRQEIVLPGHYPSRQPHRFHSYHRGR
jgi:hypothetical protein